MRQSVGHFWWTSTHFYRVYSVLQASFLISVTMHCSSETKRHFRTSASVPLLHIFCNFALFCFAVCQSRFFSQFLLQSAWTGHHSVKTKTTIDHLISPHRHSPNHLLFYWDRSLYGKKSYSCQATRERCLGWLSIYSIFLLGFTFFQRTFGCLDMD